MKKILLATTVLVGTAGFAAAEVSVSGTARMGIVNDGEDTNFSSRVRVIFSMSNQTDGGLSFGATIRADNAANGNTGDAGSVYISGAFGKLSMGDVAGAAEMAVGDLAGVGYTGLGDYSDTIFITGDGAEVGDRNPIALYEYSTGDLSFYLSGNDGNSDIYGDTTAYAVGVAYAMGDYSFGLGYETRSSDDLNVDADHIVASAQGAFGPVTVKAVYGVADVDGDDATQWGLSAVYTMDALAVTGFYKTLEDDSGTLDDFDAYGLGASYDLGGGAAVKGGIVSVDDGFDDETLYDLGVTFSF